jgi:pimeloyl-[acyl-carrier protein] methyl ester esterase
MLTLKSAALAILLTATALSPAVALAETPAAPAAQTFGATKLFADSRLIVRDRITVEVVGHGPDLVFIPGLASSRETWRATAERLRNHYRLHLVGVNGFAGEQAGANAAGEVLIPTAEAIDAYLVEAKLAPATVIGHSLGGTMILYLADHHPEHLKRAFVVDALPFFGVVFMGPQATVAQLAPIANGIRNGPPQSPGALAQQINAMVGGDADRARVTGWGQVSDRSVVQRALADDLSLDLRPDLAKITTPITLLYPDNVPDGMPAGAAEDFYRASFAGAPHVTFVRVDNSRHFIMFDQPAAFAAALDGFLGK